ncbi:MAG: hypothetical protein Q7S15_00970 [bacterium]|nr:hypothetical protein [bacterium]
MTGVLCNQDSFTEDEHYALKTLGEERFIPAQAVVLARGLSLTADTKEIRYPRTLLSRYARRNKRGVADWRLVYTCGLCLEETGVAGRQISQHKLKVVEPILFEFSSICQGTAGFEGVFRICFAPGYYLLNFNLRPYIRKRWTRQEGKINRHYQVFARPCEALVAEALDNIYKVTGKRVLENRFHWGPTADTAGSHCCVGYQGRKLILHSLFDFAYSGSVGVVVVRRPCPRVDEELNL